MQTHAQACIHWSKYTTFIYCLFQGNINNLSKGINRFFVVITLLLHIALFFVTKLHQYHQKKSQIKISIIYKPEARSLYNKNYVITLSASVFWAVVTFASFLVHSSSREIQLYILLPLQIMSCAILFPIFVIAKSENLKKHFTLEHKWILLCKNVFASKNQVGPIHFGNY